MRAFVLCMLITMGSIADAEVYRWVDENGQVHYSDRKQQADAEDVTAQTKVQNLDTSQEERRKVAQILRPENQADRDFRRRQQADANSQNQANTELQKKCRELQDYLGIMKGRVQIVDEQGKEVHFTERERQAHVAEMQSFYQQHCQQQ